MANKKHILTLVIFLLGIFMGAIDTGIVSPARVLIQNGFDISSNKGVWMITIYTLAYAVAMPIVSKLSDTFGRKKVYIISITIFAIGSALCGLTNFFGNYNLFLIARVIQAIGGGGITPIATAYIGNSFPPEKRGTALGLVGAIYGIATILGPTLGSGILDLVGSGSWGWLFFINVPISLAILAISTTIDEKQELVSTSLDLKGAAVVTITILSIMYALTNLDFYHLKDSILDVNVYPYLIVFILSLPVLIYVESRAKDPILNLHYFKSSQIAITLMISFIVGCGLMGVVFVPQFAENVLKLKSGSGGYLVTFMAVFSGITAPLGGRLVDKYSAKLVLLLGFGSTVIGSLVFSLFASNGSGTIPIFIGLAFIGLGMGFSMGTPLNYLMLAYVDQRESASALSTLSLIRSIGVAISPNIMVNFLSEAGKQTQTKLTDLTMSLIKAPSIPGMGGTFDLSKVNMGAPDPATLEVLKSADVTTIVEATKNFLSSLFDKLIPMLQTKMPKGIPSSVFTDWKASSLAAIETQRKVIEDLFQQTMNTGFKGMFLVAALIAAVGLLLTLLLHNRKAVDVVSVNHANR